MKKHLRGIRNEGHSRKSSRLKTACVAEAVHNLLGNHHEVAREDAVRAVQEAIHRGVLRGGWNAGKTMNNDEKR